MIREFLGELWAVRFATLEAVVIAIAVIATWTIARRVERRQWLKDPRRVQTLANEQTSELRRISRIQKAYIGQLEEENQALRDRLKGGLTRILQGLTIMGGDHGTGAQSWYQREAERLLKEDRAAKAAAAKAKQATA